MLEMHPTNVIHAQDFLKESWQSIEIGHPKRAAAQLVVISATIGRLQVLFFQILKVLHQILFCSQCLLTHVCTHQFWPGNAACTGHLVSLQFVLCQDMSGFGPCNITRFADRALQNAPSKNWLLSNVSPALRDLLSVSPCLHFART